MGFWTEVRQCSGLKSDNELEGALSLPSYLFKLGRKDVKRRDALLFRPSVLIFSLFWGGVKKEKLRKIKYLQKRG